MQHIGVQCQKQVSQERDVCTPPLEHERAHQSVQSDMFSRHSSSDVLQRFVSLARQSVRPLPGTHSNKTDRTLTRRH